MNAGRVPRRAAWAALSAVVVAATAAIAVTAVGAAPGGNGKGKGLSKGDIALVAAAKASGKPTVSLVIAAQPAKTTAVAAAVKGYGAAIADENDQVGYIHAEVPTAQATVAAKVAGISAVNIDRAIPAVVPAPEAKAGSNGPPLDVGALGPDNPYMPTSVIGAPQFVAAHPTYDGRGVRVGIVDLGVDVDRPELQTAADLQGRPVPKIVDWVTETAPRLDDPANGDPTWVPMSQVALNPDGQNIATSAGKYQLPAALKNTTDKLVFGVFNEGDPRLGGEVGSDVNRDGDSNDSFGVLEDTATRTVWVDTNQNGNFLDDMAMQDFKVNRDVNHFGKDSPSTKDVVESMPFVVQTTSNAAFVNIGIVSGGHGTHVAGTVAGKGFFGGRFNGVAPNAQLAVARVCLFITGCFTSDQINAFLYLIRTDHVDLIQMSIGGLPALNDDAFDAESTIVDQITAIFGTQFFFSNGNDGPGANTVGSPATANVAIGSGAYQSQATWAANYGNQVSKQDTLWTFSSRGPREDGGLKPNVISPGSELSTWPAWDMSENPFQGGVGARPYGLPAGYEMIQGTSMASPMTAGAAALLLSAARQNGLAPTAAQLRKAIQSGARFIPGYQAYEQGNGLVNVGAAWDILKTNPSTPAVSSTASVNTVLAQAITASGTPYDGVGIHEREGWKPGDSGTRTITFSGDAGTYNVSWLGNDGTFSSASTLTIPSSGSVGLAVHVGPVTAGIHSAILRLDDPSSPGIEYATLNTIMAADQFPTSGANAFQISHTASPDRADKKSFFVNVAPGTAALELDETVTSGRTKLDVIDPFGDPVVPKLPCGCTADFATAPATKTTAIQNPMAGVWEIDVETSRTSTVDPGTASFTASELGVTIAPASWTIDPATPGTASTSTFSFSNTKAPFTGNAAGTPLGSAFKATPTAVDDGDPSTADTQQAFSIAVPSGATSLHVQIGNPADARADLDLFLVDPSGNLVAQSAGPTPNEQVTIADPVAGTYTAVVDDFSVPTGSTTYDYADLIAEPGLGSVTVSDPSALRPTGAHWTAAASVTPTGAPGAGRFLQGFVQVVAGTAVVGKAEVDLNVH